MAKKKVSHSHKDKQLQKQEDFVKPQQQQQQITAAMDSEEKLESLKSLNQMLLKEAFERRHQVDSLIQSKGDLESELIKSKSENEVFFSELTQLEIERNVVDLFVSVQLSQKGEVIEKEIKDLDREVRDLKRVVDEKEFEIGRLNEKLIESEVVLGNEREVSRRVCVERDDLKDKLDGQIVEGERLRANLIEMEVRNREVKREIGDLRVVYDEVVGEKEERERRIKSIMREKEFIEKGLAELNKLVDETKEELRGVVREKEGIKEEKNAEMDERRELENAVSGLNEMVVSLQKEEGKLRVNVAELEKKCYEGEEKQKEMVREISQLVEERKLSEKRFEGLIDEKDMVEKNLCKALKQLENERQKIEELGNEKVVVLEAKDRLDAEVGTLKNQVAELKAVVLIKEESCMVRVEKIKSLESEVGDYKCKLDQIKVERDEIRNYLDEETQNGLRLKRQIEDLEKKIEESLKVVEETKAENGELLVQKMELEGQCERLKRDISSLENTLNEARDEFNSMKGKFECADAKKEMVLNMLKDTAVFCAKDEKDSLGSKQVEIEETNPCGLGFEVIKNAFKSKETKMEDMKRQLEFLQNSVKVANKKKSFWTVFSSATTLLAAVSLAYAARGH